MGALLTSALAPVSAVAKDNEVLMLLWRGITEPEIAFKERLAALGVSVNYTEIVGDQDRNLMATRARALEGDIAAGKFSVVYAFGTTVSQVALSVIRGRVPVVFNIVFDPVAGKLVQSMDKPGGAVTGVTNGVPIEDQFDSFLKLGPIGKGLVVLFNAREPNSNIIEKRVSDWAKKNKVNFVSRRVTPDNDSLQVVLEDIKAGKVEADALYAGADSYLGSKSKDIQQAIGDKIHLFGGTGTFVLNGWLAAYTPPVKEMGYAAAELVARVLKGEDAGSIPVVLPQPKLIMSGSAAEKHGVAIPAGAIVEK